MLVLQLGGGVDGVAFLAVSQLGPGHLLYFKLMGAFGINPVCKLQRAVGGHEILGINPYITKPALSELYISLPRPTVWVFEYFMVASQYNDGKYHYPYGSHKRNKNNLENPFDYLYRTACGGNFGNVILIVKGFVYIFGFVEAFIIQNLFVILSFYIISGL